MSASYRSGFADLLGSVALVAVLAVLMPGLTVSSARAAEEPSAEPAPEAAAPPSGGWVPQGEGGAASNGGSDGPTQGSVLGSGSSPEPTPPPVVEPAPSPPPLPSPDTDYEEPAPKPAPGSEEQLRSPPSETAVAPTGAPAAKPDSEGSAPVAVGRSVALAGVEPRQAVLGVSAESPPVAAVPAASTDDAGLGTARLLAIILCCCILVYAGARLVLGPVEPNWPIWSRYRPRR